LALSFTAVVYGQSFVVFEFAPCLDVSHSNCCPTYRNTQFVKHRKDKMWRNLSTGRRHILLARAGDPTTIQHPRPGSRGLHSPLSTGVAHSPSFRRALRFQGDLGGTPALSSPTAGMLTASHPRLLLSSPFPSSLLLPVHFGLRVLHVASPGLVRDLR
jgi:hypothetical protein